MISENDRILQLYVEVLALPEEEQKSYLEKLRLTDPDVVDQLQKMMDASAEPGRFDQLVARFEDESPALIIQEVVSSSGSPPRIIGKYEIQDQLGGGGMGVVYRAFDTQLKRAVALKFLREDLTSDAEAKARLLIEAQAAAGLDHPNICTIYEVGETDKGQLYLAMPCYEGETLKQKLSHGPLSFADATNYIRQTAQGLERAHAAGIVHRDIKPANLLVTPDGTLKVLDFGIAKRTEDQLTADGSRLGTLAYMSPEQLRSEEVDHRTDVWALGVVLFELLTGRRPFGGEYEYALMYALMHEDPVAVQSLRPDVPDALQRVISGALKKDKSARLQSATVFLRLLQHKAIHDTVPEALVAKPEPIRRIKGDGERVQVTLVMSTVNGYFDFVEEMAPDTLKSKMAALHAKVTGTATDHGGMVYQFRGEEIVILFGVPDSHEDDGLRAVRAALALREAVAKDGGISLRIAIASGALVARQSSDTSKPIEVTGNLILLARTMVARSEEDKILLEGESARLVRTHFSVEENGEIKARDKGKAVPLYLLGDERVMASPVHGDIEAGLTVFTGRQRELDTIHRCFERVLGGEGQFVTINGEAGLGKSRLSYEFRNSLMDRNVTLLMGRCQPYGSYTPYVPFLQVLRVAIGIHTMKADEIEADRVVEAICKISEDLKQLMSVYLNLLGLEHPEYGLPSEIDGNHLHHAIKESFSALMISLSRAKPLVLVLDDWHWADEGSRDILNQLVELLASQRVFILLTYRPSFVPDWGHPECHSPIRLHPLNEEEIDVMIKRLLKVKELPVGVVSVLMERTEGNPFFLEELMSSLLESSRLEVHNNRLVVHGAIDHTTVPGSVQAVLRTRIERLPESSRMLLLSASVIGRSFTAPLLKEIMPDARKFDEQVDPIRKRGLMQQTNVLPEVEYRFKHALMQEVAYDSLLNHQRKRLHGKVGASIESLYPEQIDEQPFRLAHHFGEAELWEKALLYAERASELAYDTIQYSENKAINNLIIKWVDHLEDHAQARALKIKTILKQEFLCECLFLKEERIQLLDTLFELIDRDKEKTLLCEYYIRKGNFQTEDYLYAEAEKNFDKALEIAREIEDVKALRKAMKSKGWLYWRTDRNELARKINQQVYDSLKEEGRFSDMLGTLINLVNLYVGVGDLETARLYTDELCTLLPEVISYESSLIFFVQGRVKYLEGDLEEAEEFIHKGIRIWDSMLSGKHNLIHLRGFARIPHSFTVLGRIKLEQEKFEEAEYYFNRTLSAHSGGMGRLDEKADALLILGNYFLQRGRIVEGVERLEEAQQICEKYNIKTGLIHVCTSLAIAYDQLENYPGAFVNWERVQALSMEMSNSENLLKSLEGKVRVARFQGRDQRMIISLQEDVLEYVKEQGIREKQAEVHNTLGILEWERERFAIARDNFKCALEIFNELEDHIHAGLMFNAIGAAEAKLSRFDEAIETLEQALIHHGKTGEKMLTGHALATMGDIERDRANYEKALTHYGDSLTVRWEIEDRAGEGWMLERIAQIHILQGKVKDAKKETQKALEIAQECGDQKLLDACQQALSQMQ